MPQPFPVSLLGDSSGKFLGDTNSDHNDHHRELESILVGPVFFNVKGKDYGALGDGTTNDTAAIQGAINACAAAGGGIVFFPGGVYLVTGITVPTSVILLGVGRAPWASTGFTASATIIKATTGCVTVIDIAGVSGDNTRQAEHVTIQDLSVDGAGIATNGIRVWNFRYINLSRLFVKSSTVDLLTGKTLSTDDAYALHLDDVLLTNATNGWSTAGSGGEVEARAYGVSIRSCTGDFIGGWNAVGAYSGSDGLGAKLRGIISNAIIGGGAATGIGIHITDSSRMTIDACSIENSGGNAAASVRIDGSATGAVIIRGTNPTTTSGGPTGRAFGYHILRAGSLSIYGNRIRWFSGKDIAGFVGIAIDSTVDREMVEVGANEFVSFTSAQSPVTYAGAAVGPVLRAGLIYLKPSSDFPKTSDTTLADVPGLARAVKALRRYRFWGQIAYDGSTTGDIKILPVAPTGAAQDIEWSMRALDTGATTVAGDIRAQSRNSNTNIAAGAVGAGTPVTAWVEGTFVPGSDADFKIQAAQNTSDATATTIFADESFIFLEPF
jgi:hypothetical protein